MAAEVVDVETGEVTPADFPDVRLDRRFIVKREGKDFVLYAGLLDLLHQLSVGYFDITTTLVQIPNDANGQTAICTARVVIFDPDNPDVARRVAGGIGDAAPGNVTRMMAPHLIRMAETRAKARALRDAVNVGMVSLEELGGEEVRAAQETPQARQEARPASFGPPPGERPVPVAPAVERIQIKGRWYTRDEVMPVFLERLEAAAKAGLQLAPMGQPGGPPPPGAPLPAIVGFSQELLRRLDARSGAVHASGK